MVESYDCQAIWAYKHVPLTATQLLPALFVGSETEKVSAFRPRHNIPSMEFLLIVYLSFMNAAHCIVDDEP